MKINTYNIVVAVIILVLACVVGVQRGGRGKVECRAEIGWAVKRAGPSEKV